MSDEMNLAMEPEEFEFAEDPTFAVNYKGDCAYEVGVVVPASNRQKQAEEMYDELREEVELPGFRRGRAPIKLVQRKFSRAVQGEVTGKLVSAAFEKLIKDEDLKPAGLPDVDGLEDDEDAEPDPNAALEFTLKFEVAPRVELGKYRGIDVERPVVPIDDQDVEEFIEELRERNATYEAVEDAKAEKDDQLVIDFKGTIEGEAFEGGSAENYPYILGSGRFFSEFEDALDGASPGDELSCEVTFPDDYFSEDLCGKTAIFEIQVHEIKRKMLPEINDELAENSGFENVAAMKEGIRERLAEDSKDRSRQIAESRAMEAIIESSTFEIPKSLIESVTAQQKQEQIERMLRMGMPPDAIDELSGKLDEESAESALRTIKSTVVLQEIADAEGLDVTEEDFEKEAETLSQSVGASVEAISAFITQPDQRADYTDRILRSKAMDVIMDNANITDKELTREELEEAEAEDIPEAAESADEATD